jgi:glycosyltransferase involved in cell wall biosynthesis
MRLCVVVPSFYPATIYGGPIVSIEHTCNALSKRGVEVYVSTTNANGAEKLRVQTNIFNMFSKNYFVKYYDDTVVGRFSWSFCRYISGDIKKSDVVKIEDIFSTYVLVALFFCFFHKKKIMLSVRGVMSAWALASKKRLFKKVWLFLFLRPFERSILWHATSEAESTEVTDQFPNAKVVVIPNGICLDEYTNLPSVSRSAYLEAFGVPVHEATRIIVSMGRLHRVKGFPLLIHAFATLRERIPNVLLLVAGEDDGMRSELDSLIRGLGLVDCVFLVGSLEGDKKRLFLAGADVFALTSYSENFGNVYLEALASGTPILATEGTPWRHIDSHDCGHCTSYDREEIADALEALLSSDRNEMRVKAAQFASKYSWGEIADEIYSELRVLSGKS